MGRGGGICGRLAVTPRQQEALEAIQRFVAERSRAPSVGEVANELGVTYSAAHQLVVKLEQIGKVTRGVCLMACNSYSGSAA